MPTLFNVDQRFLSFSVAAYCTFRNFRENFIFANSIKIHISDVKNLRLRLDLPISINDRVILSFREGFIFTKLRICENKVLAKNSEFTVCASSWCFGSYIAIARLSSLSDAYNLITDFVYFHTLCMWAFNALVRFDWKVIYVFACCFLIVPKLMCWPILYNWAVTSDFQQCGIWQV